MTPCRHFWRIGKPIGKEAPGTCAHCGEQRMFQNTLEFAWTTNIKLRRSTDEMRFAEAN